ncbi:O-methyltransferase COMT-type [Heracleum sosnowskyi]|uniref:O-methyltransferase COMT-type n=1 Tax=Heracleum sosnowskyi TaxID=360622 RepID=A0AAD8LXW1_9APIA|nr:O-methyltransferase COMT-type [Heracleum sosnowskyi]
MTEIIDVAGGTGATLAKYPQIKGINFDLPHVIKNAAPLPGVEHIEGDMFESVPKGAVTFMKWILHDWSNEHCLKLLRNCWNTLPEFGKVVIVESVVPKYTNTGSSSKLSNVMGDDMVLLALYQGGKERSLKEFEALAKQSGFAVELICNAATYSVLEFHKKE